MGGGDESAASGGDGGNETAIDEAITAHVAAGGDADVVTGWVVIAAVINANEEQERSGVVIVYPNGQMPWQTALGIVEAGRLRIQHQYLHGHEEP